MIELRNLSKRYGSPTGDPAGDAMAVDDVCLEVARGELMMLVGGSGSGKTTTLKLINRLIEPSGGSVWIDGADTEGLSGPELRRRIGYCFQGVGLFPHLSVRENVGVTPRLLDWAPDAIAERVDALLRLVDLDPQQYGDRAPDALSGGQRQRVGLARALAAKPELMLLDEPFGALDPLIRESLQSAFQELRRELGLTAIFVTHDMVEALLLADRIAVLHAGRLVQVGTPAELLAAPADEHVAALLRTPKRQAQALEEVGGAP